MVFPLPAGRGGTGIINAPLGLECAYTAAAAETLTHMVFFLPTRSPPPVDPVTPFPPPKHSPMWPIVLAMHDQGSSHPRPPSGGDVVTNLHKCLEVLAASGAADYFDKHLNASCPHLPRSVAEFIDYFGRAGTPTYRLQKHFMSFLTKKQYDRVFQT